jgi:predicted phage baseplate assembly protein
VAAYRIGNGSQGNVGAETIAHVVVEDGQREHALEEKIKCVRNPMPARGGRDPEDIRSAILHAPYAYRARRGCVTQADYARHASRHPAVVHAVARTRWIGSRRTVVIYVQRAGGQPVDDDFQQELRAFVEPCRLMGHDIEIEAPRYVPVRVKLRVHLEPRAPAVTAHQGLSKAFGEEIWPDGEVGFFHPDRFGFGQSVHQSQVIVRAMAVAGVARVEVEQFRRGDSDLDVTEIPIGPSEIARLDRIDFSFVGGP